AVGDVREFRGFVGGGPGRGSIPMGRPPRSSAPNRSPTSWAACLRFSGLWICLVGAGARCRGHRASAAARSPVAAGEVGRAHDVDHGRGSHRAWHRLRDRRRGVELLSLSYPWGVTGETDLRSLMDVDLRKLRYFVAVAVTLLLHTRM